MFSEGRCRKKPPRYCVESCESIYNLLKKPCDVPPKPPLHKSRYSLLIKDQIKRQKKFAHRTFGLPLLPLRPAKDFLRKLQKVVHPVKEPKLDVNGDPCKKLEEMKKKEVQQVCKPGKKRESIKESFKHSDQKFVKKKYEELPSICNENNEKTGEQTCDCGVVKEKKKVVEKRKKTNFISRNAKAVIDSKPPPRTSKMVVFTRKGDKLDFEGAGLDMKFCRSEAFAKKPEYLEKRRKQVEAARDEYDEKISENMRACALKKLCPDEREEMLACLQENHDKLYQQYYKLPVLIHTSLMKNKKMKLETQLAQLEHDIRLISAHPEIYVAH